MLSKQQIQKFRQLYQARFGIDISYQEAHSKALNLLILYRAVYCSPSQLNKYYENKTR